MENSVTVTLDEANFDREVMQSEKPVLVDFWAEWCGPCKMIAPLLDEIAREKGDSVKVAKVNVDDNQSLSFKYNIRAIPSLLRCRFIRRRRFFGNSRSSTANTSSDAIRPATSRSKPRPSRGITHA